MYMHISCNLSISVFLVMQLRSGNITFWYSLPLKVINLYSTYEGTSTSTCLQYWILLRVSCLKRMVCLLAALFKKMVCLLAAS